jgi:threonine/homoserine/homoserine lactone efflux protein
MLIPFLYLLTSTVSPGPVTILTIHNTSKHGRLPGFAVALGGAVTTAVFVIIAFILTTNSYLNDISTNTANYFQQISAILILLMGLHTGYRSLFADPQQEKQLPHSSQIKQCFLTGFLLMLPHLPAAILFYTVILPQYANAANLTQMVFIMGLLKILMTVCWYTAISFAAKPIQKWLNNVKIQRVLEFGVACFLVVISITILV